MRTRWSPFLVGVLVAACAGGAPATGPASAPTGSSSPAVPTPVAEPTVNRTVEPSLEPSIPSVEPSHQPTARPTQKPTVQPTQRPTPGGPSGAPVEPTVRPSDCPTVPVLTPVEFVNADAACFGSRDVTLQAWLGGLPSMGWEAPYIEPAWLAYPPDFPLLNALWQRGPGGDAMCGSDEDCAYVIIHVRPETTIVLGSTPRWVTATGHLADPMAELCRYEPWGGTSPPDSEAQAECRRSFVLTSVRDAEPPSP